MPGARTDPLGAGRQHRTPYRRIDAAPLPSAAERDQYQRDLAEMASQVHARADDAPDRAIDLLELVGLLAVLAHQAFERLTVQGRKPGDDVRVVDQDEAPFLTDVRGTDGRVEDPSASPRYKGGNPDQAN